MAEGTFILWEIRRLNRTWPIKYFNTLVIVSAATGLQWLLWPIIDPAPFILFYPAIILASLYGDGIIAIILSLLATGYFFVPPMHSLEISWPAGFMRHAMFLISALMIRHLTRALSTALLHAQEEKKTADQEKARAQEAEVRLSTTLRSIGDAVIATDREGRVSFMNPIAESLTEWKLSEARGRPLTEVFHIINQKTRERVPDPVEKVLEKGGIVGLANHTVILGRNGKEATIEDSAAPIRTSEAGSIQGVVLVFRDITEKYSQEEKLAEAFRQLQLSEARLRSILDNALDAVVGMDVHGRITHWNPQAEKIFGYSPDEAVGRRMSETIIPHQYRAAHEKGMRHYLATDEGPVLDRRIEITALRRDGTEFPIELAITPVKTSALTFFAAFIRDITEQKRIATDLLLKSDALENSLNGFDIVDAQGNFIYANRAYLTMWGYESLDEILGTPAVAHCADPGTPEKIIRTLMEKGDCDIEFTARRRDGSSFEVRMWARLAHDQDGNAIFPSTSIDITERKMAEKDRENLLRREQQALGEARTSLSKLDAVVHNLTEGLVFADPEGNILLMNPEALRIHEFHSKDAMIRTLKEHPSLFVIHAADGNELPLEDWPLSRVLRGEKFTECEVEVHRLDTGKRWIGSYGGTPVLDDHGKLVLAVLTVRDVTEKRKTEQALKEAIRARDEFISICSHELKTPITSMKLQFQMAERRIRKGDRNVFDEMQVERRVIIANKQLDRMSKLIEEMLDVSRSNTGNLQLASEEVDLADLVREVIERFSEQLTELGIPVDVKIEAGKYVIIGDHYRLEQVLSNLVTNAMKYGSGSPIHVSLGTTGNRVRLTVRDEGNGIAKENLDRIFHRYERAVSASSVSGLGLGLYITRKIVEAHQGEIWVESELGWGASFHVELPLSESAGTQSVS